LKDQNYQFHLLQETLSESKENLHGKMNGVVTFSSRMDQITAKVFVFL